jgi:O-succinylbenzoate synthase
MKLDRLDILHTCIPLNQTFRTSFGAINEQHSIVVKAYSDGLVAYGEACPFYAPVYSYECIATMTAVIRDFIAPAVLGRELGEPAGPGYAEATDFIKGNNHAKAAVETALWDLESERRGIPLWKLVGGTNPKVDVGVSIGIQPTVEGLLDKIDGYLNEGYRRIKIKIEPGKDLDTVKAIRARFPEITLMVDANSSYELSHAELLAGLDGYGLLMMEQPLAEDDIVDHAKLQSQISTPVCLDESIHTPEDARKAAELGSCKIINIKYGRVGGIRNSIRIHDICRAAGIGNWAGGMIETGIGQRFKLAISTLPNFVYAADIETSDRFLVEDVVTPDIMHVNGYLDANTDYRVDEVKLNRYTSEVTICRP